MSPRAVSVPKYRHHKGSGQALVQLNGRRHYLGKWDSPKSKEAYARFIAELAVAPATAPPTPATPASALTVVELCAAYLDFADAYYRQKGRRTSEFHVVRQAMRPLLERYGSTPAEKFGPLALRAVQSQLIERGLARKTINHLCGTIKRIFRWAVSRELVPVAVFQALLTVPGVAKGRTAAREPEPILPVPDDLVEATVPHLPKVVGDMVRFQRLTGCRPGEVCQIRPCDLDRSGDVWEYRPATHKTAYRGRERIIYVGPKAQGILTPYLLRDAQASCFSPAESEQKRHVEMRAKRKTWEQFKKRTPRKAKPKRVLRTAYDKDSYQRAITRAVVKANKERTEAAADMGVAPILLPHWHANQLRHAAATEVRRLYGLEAAQTILGHAQADVTQIYAERDAKLAVEVSRKIG